MTLRKCDTNFDNKMKSKISAKLMKKSPLAAKFIYKRFSWISWAFVLLMFWSIISIGIGAYNTVVYGNCNGEESTDFCLFNPEMTGNSGHSMHEGLEKKDLIPASADDDPSLGGENAKVTIIEFGCFRCKYTKKAEETMKKLLEKYGDKIKIVFRNFPLPSHDLSRETAEAAECAKEQDKYWEYHDKLFENQKTISLEKIKSIAGEVDLNQEKFNECFDSRKYQQEVEKDHQDGLKSGIYGTPTFFINGRPLVGPRTFEEFVQIIDEELAK